MGGDRVVCFGSARGTKLIPIASINEVEGAGIEVCSAALRVV